GLAGLVETAGLDLVQDLPALLAPADKAGALEHDQVLGDGLAGERHPPAQPAGADLAVADQEVEDLAAGRGRRWPTTARRRAAWSWRVSASRRPCPGGRGNR